LEEEARTGELQKSQRGLQGLHQLEVVSRFQDTAWGDLGRSQRNLPWHGNGQSMKAEETLGGGELEDIFPRSWLVQTEQEATKVYNTLCLGTRFPVDT
jgi:hypothetical protein